MMRKVKITSGIANEYMTRDVYPYAWDEGVIGVSDEQFWELLEDAVFNADPKATDMPGSIRRMYQLHLERLSK